MNSVILMGRITATPELKYTDKASTPYLGFVLAVDRATSTEKKTDFIYCKAFSKTAEIIAKYINKGDAFAIEGSIATPTFVDKDGRTIHKTEVLVNRFHFVPRNSDKSKQTTLEPEPQPQQDALPF